MTDYPASIRQHPVAQLIDWSCRTGERIKSTDLDEADVPASLRSRVLDAAGPIRAIYGSGAQQDARDAAAGFVDSLLPLYPRDHAPKKDPLPDDPRALAALIHRN